MRIAIIGSRDFCGQYCDASTGFHHAGTCSLGHAQAVVRGIVHNRVDRDTDIVISGAARGVDSWAAAYARKCGIAVEEFAVTSEQWRQSRGAGIARNATMLSTADAVYAVWNGTSPGTKHGWGFARDRGILRGVFVVRDRVVSVLDRESLL